MESHYSIELFWYPLNSADVKGFNASAWDPYADRLMVYQAQRAAAPPGGPAPRPYSSKPNVAANLETYLGAVATNVGVKTGNLAVQVQPQQGFGLCPCQKAGIHVSHMVPSVHHVLTSPATSARYVANVDHLAGTWFVASADTVMQLKQHFP